MNLMVFNFLSIVHYSITLPHRRVMLLCAGILGRYYTDWHNVDEDLISIPDYGGPWREGSNTGVTQRYMDCPLCLEASNVASRLIYLS